jgi:uncharacterized protein (DUF362 family)
MPNLNLRPKKGLRFSNLLKKGIATVFHYESSDASIGETLMSIVSLVKFDEQRMSLQQSIGKSLDLINFQFNTAVKKIAIKPNMCYYWDYSTGETTDPKFVSALVDVIRKHLSKKTEISIVESDASAMKCRYAFRMLGYEKMAAEKGVRLVNLTNDKTKKVETTIRGKTCEFLLPRTIAEADLFINVPKIKYMQKVEISGTLKNLFGCNPYLCILDGIIIRGIETMKLGLIMASTDPVAIDAAASEIAGANPRSIVHLKLAYQEKLGNINFIQKGESLNYFRKLFPRKNIKYRSRRILSALYNRLVPQQS